MKKITSLLLLFFTLLQLPAQTKPDVVLKTNGEEMTGKVSAINDNEIQFTYQGETLVYSIKTADIAKITFGSGRVQVFNKPAETTPAPATSGDPRNKVAVLPFGYVKNSQSASDDMAMKAQNETYSFLKKTTLPYTFLDPRTTNAMLAKAGITRSEMQKYTMEEICNILGVEYVVDGTITQNQAATTSSSSTSYSDNSKKKDEGNKRENSGYGYSSTSTQINYETAVSIDIYNNKNDNLFSENRRSLLNQNEGIYENTLNYLLKRCPLYKK